MENEEKEIGQENHIGECRKSRKFLYVGSSDARSPPAFFTGLTSRLPVVGGLFPRIACYYVCLSHPRWALSDVLTSEGRLRLAVRCSL